MKRINELILNDVIDIVCYYLDEIFYELIQIFILRELYLGAKTNFDIERINETDLH